ncbi:MAG: sigma-70 family RNA polymerase sigma factor [Planctomycetes bacterium]|nr:sigma-70 family RNA polymerase sigma factor [Planctomycetota bacterium]
MPSSEVTRLLTEIRQGDANAAERLLPLVYEELRTLAGRLMRSERTGHTLQPTALVHEAYLRLVGADVGWQGRSHFVGVAARAMRQILVNHALARRAEKRGGGRTPVSLELDDAVVAFESRSIDLIALDEALKKLGEVDPDQCRIVECRFFVGMTMIEIAELTERPLRSVEQDWSMARAWLRRQLDDSFASE